MSDPLLRIENRHALGCGDPPIIDADDPALYVGYFESPLGDQWIFTYHRETEDGLLYGGDTGWNRPLVVHEGQVVGLVLRPEELAWLSACWRAATRILSATP